MMQPRIRGLGQVYDRCDEYVHKKRHQRRIYKFNGSRNYKSNQPLVVKFINWKPFSHQMTGPGRKYITLFLRSSYECLYKCPDCLHSCGPNGEYYSKGMQLKILEDLINLAPITNGALLTGGEPMLRPIDSNIMIQGLSSLGIRSVLESSYLGENQESIGFHVQTLKESGLYGLGVSLDYFHEKGFPKRIDLSYEKYIEAIVNQCIIQGLPQIRVNSVIDWSFGLITENMRRKLQKAIGVEFNTRYNDIPLSFAYVKDTEVILSSSPIILAGRAKSTKQQQMLRETSYKCPDSARKQSVPITISPDGSVAPCCTATRGADFGLPNYNDVNLRELKQEIEEGRFFQPTKKNLFDAAIFLMKEAPDHLPRHMNMACDICNAATTFPDRSALESALR